MIRRAIIVMLALAAIATMGVSILSYLDWPGSWTFDHASSGLTLNHHVTRVWRIGRTGQYSYWFEVSQGRLYSPVRVPVWALVALLATCPAVAVIHGPLRRWNRRRRGLCLRCGYNLTGNASGICPECGKKIENP